MAVYTQSYKTPPEDLTIYQGGLYIGTFYPGPPLNPTSSDLLGNKNTGKPQTYKTYSYGPGENTFAWGIIVYFRDYNPSRNISYFSTNDPISSYMTSEYDGQYNKQENTAFYARLKSSATYGGFDDWYIPSVDELAFITNKIPVGYYIPKTFDAFYPGIYRSSTYVTENETENSSFFYGQSFEKTKYGNVSLVSRTSTETKIRLIRKLRLIKE